MAKEAQARIKINKLLDAAGWRFFDDKNGKANIILENNVKLTETVISALGENYEKSKNGFIDFLLLDDRGFPFIVLEAKSEDKDPLIAKEQARGYAKSQNCRFIILSNGNLHYFWDLQQGDPHIITQFPSPGNIIDYKSFTPNPSRLVDEKVENDYIALTQLPKYYTDASWINESERPDFITKNKLKFLRDYQRKAVESIQSAVKENKTRFLFEMATGTGKTLIAAAVIKLFLRTENARRVLFLVDRLELEDQAKNAFIDYLHNDYKTIVFKENKQDWRHAEIVVTTVQSLLFDNKYRQLFAQTDFDLIISDEAHRSIGGNARALFEYFFGYKLGLTATPKDYLKNSMKVDDIRDIERRILLDTYRTFGCESGNPTYRFSLIDGVKAGFLINPKVIDARTDVTTQLLSDEGYAVPIKNENGEDDEEIFKQRDFEKKFFSDDTNRVFCEAFLKNALLDPISGEIGKTIVFTVSQHHASKITQQLNILASQMFPGRYNSDFAMQVTSQIPTAQQFTLNFRNNILGGSGNFIAEYKTSKTRVCVTVGMMTTGYDCSDILNLCLMRPIFSPSDFVQIKGRGTRKHNFFESYRGDKDLLNVPFPDKTEFKLFDFFANCEYFEEKFDYDEEIKVPLPYPGGKKVLPPPVYDAYANPNPDFIRDITTIPIGPEGMRIDRMFFNQFAEKVKNDPFIQEQVSEGNWDKVVSYLNSNVLNKPVEFFTLEKLRKALGVDRKITVRELLEHIYDLIPFIKSSEQLLDEEFEKFVLDQKPADPAAIVAIKYFFKAYASDKKVREIIDNGSLTDLYVSSVFSMEDYKLVPKEWRERIPAYIKDYVSPDRFS